MKKKLGLIAAAAVLLTTAACGGGASNTESTSAKPTETAATSQTLNVYSSRHYDVDKEVYAKFEEKTGIKLNVVEGKSGELVERVIREKDTPQADVFLTVGAESISQLSEVDALGKATSRTIETNVPQKFRGDGWMGITTRARVIAYATDRVNPSEITSYDDLTTDKWKKKVLVRSSESSYNQALLSSFVELNGEEKAKEWAQGIVDNMARTPSGNDRDQAKAVAAGEGDIAIMNSYYYVRMMRSTDPEEANAAQKIGLIFPKDTHLNISYAGVLKGSKNQENAIKFLEFLSSEEVQAIYAEENGEFPVNPAVALPEIQESWGEFTTQDLDFQEFGKNKPTAMRIFDEVGWK
ncbi:extracellular solute-binding protein [Corynebacterium caspium]|uniref:extracellular solute-binding protein n=1 Tax=Corynebacterium caspium TaxID=234828 RepID=UPI00037CA0A6|nr:extracellular solute-binding protein [Corynebacterium caspium]WKD59535.1 Iron uptake protein A1 precursor [Corynebacterium caspium DSM 44850]